MAYELDVWLFSKRLDKLILVEGRLNFLYTTDWLSQPNAMPLSTLLPVLEKCWAC